MINLDFKPTENQIFIIMNALDNTVRAKLAQAIKMAAEEQTEHTEYFMPLVLKDYFEAAAVLDGYDPIAKSRTAIEASADDLAFLQDQINVHSKPELAKPEGHVTQVWYDGEITSQKAGELLWQRSLHSREQGIDGVEFPVTWPASTSRGKGYIFTDDAGAKAVRKAIVNITMNALKGKQPV
jgi:hypothetical protein